MINFLRRCWLDGRLYLANAVIGHVPSHLLRLWFYRAVLRASIGRGSSIFMAARFDMVGGLTVGEDTTINRGCRLDTRGKLTIGSRVSISEDVLLLTAEHAVKEADFAGTRAPIVIEDYVFIGTRAMILPGVTLARGAVVAAGAVVTKSVAEYQIVAGIPARVIGQRRSDLDYSAHYRRLFQ